QLVFWLGHLPQRPAVVAGLSARLAVGLLAQRPWFRRRLGQPVRGRRLARVARVGGPPRLQLGDPPQGPVPPAASSDQLFTKRNDQRGKHLIRGARRVVGHNWTLRTRHLNPRHRTESGASTTTRTANKDLQDLTSYVGRNSEGGFCRATKAPCCIP